MLKDFDKKIGYFSTSPYGT